MNRCSTAHNSQSCTTDKQPENRLDVLTLELVVLYSFVSISHVSLPDNEKAAGFFLSLFHFFVVYLPVILWDCTLVPLAFLQGREKCESLFFQLPEVGRESIILSVIRINLGPNLIQTAFLQQNGQILIGHNSLTYRNKFRPAGCGCLFYLFPVIKPPTPIRGTIPSMRS